MRRHLALGAALIAALAAAAAPAAASDPEHHSDQADPGAPGDGTPREARQGGPFPCEDGTAAGVYPCENVDLASFLPLLILGGATGNDIWGWTDPQTGREYAIIGSTDSTGFVDVTTPEDPVVVGYLPGRGIPDFVLWRDIKVDGNYAFIVSETSGSGLQVFDLTRLRDAGPTPQLFTEDAAYDEFGHAHNIAINEESDFAYVVGSDTCANLPQGGEDPESGGLHMIDISDPLDPQFAGCATVEDVDGDPETESNNYIHDVQCVNYSGPDPDYQGREICLGSNEAVVAIYDVTDKASPEVISTTGYPTAAYTHQGWLTEDQRYFLFGDELDEMDGTVDNTTTYIMPVSDLDAPGEPQPFAHQTNSIDHNLYIHGQRVFQSNYMAGLRILEFDEQSLAAGSLNEVGYFDVVPGADAPDFAGTWSNYRFPGSGTVVVSTIEQQHSGLFVLIPRLGDAQPPGDGQPGDGGPGDGEQPPGDGQQPPGDGERPRCRGKRATIVGTEGDDVIRGTQGRDVIRALAGDDEIRGRGGDDVICANQGRDEARGGGQRDRIFGGRGSDLLRGGGFGDELRGQRGPDDLRGQRGRDELDGNRGDDVLRGRKGPDDLRGQRHDDDHRGGAGRDRCRDLNGDNTFRSCER